MSTILKQTACVTAGLGAVAIAAWFLAVRPVSNTLASLRSKVALQQVALAGAPTLRDDHARQLADLQARIDNARSIIAETPSPDSLYDAVQEAGKLADVRVEKLEPSSSARKPIDLAKQAGYKAEPTQLDIEVTGEFEAVVSFLTRVERDFGLSKVNSVRVQPLPGQPEHGTKVVAQVATAHFAAVPTAPPVPHSTPNSAADAPTSASMEPR